MVNRGASSSPLRRCAWQAMQALPGCISGDSRSPPVHILPLVHTGGPSNGPGAAVQSPGGAPAVTQASNAEISVAVAAGAGGGGIGAAVDWSRVSARCAIITPFAFLVVRSR